jgi:UDP-N-acetylglucosamine--N-acetylmuramyl-(pentapeptide) pyrophosphoryl-undecaprenol N-acetylglucosamine transferase
MRFPAVSHDDILWIGSRGGMEQGLVERAGLAFIGLAAGGIRGVGIAAGTRNALHIARSVPQARSILRQFKPDVVFITGGYATVAVGLAAWSLRLPVVIYLPDIIPGMAIRTLSRLATRVAVTTEVSYQFFRREKVTVTGYPVRRSVFETSQLEARQAMELDPEERTLLVFGGSRGARSINRALTAGLRELLPVCQIVHVSGRLDADWVRGVAKSLPEALRSRHHHYEYMHNMPQALAAADLVLSRAGAATLGEFPAAGLPAVLVPYPHAGQHQAANAAHLAGAGAAVVIDDAELERKLVPTVLRLFRDSELLGEMGQVARSLARPDAATAIAQVLWQATRRQPDKTSGAGT